jgi:hypothetical protein
MSTSQLLRVRGERDRCCEEAAARATLRHLWARSVALARRDNVVDWTAP